MDKGVRVNLGDITVAEVNDHTRFNLTTKVNKEKTRGRARFARVIIDSPDHFKNSDDNLTSVGMNIYLISGLKEVTIVLTDGKEVAVENIENIAEIYLLFDCEGAETQ